MVLASKKTFIDSSFFIAFIDRADVNYAKSVRLLELLASQKYKVYTSEIVILQTFNAIERDLGLTVGNEFLQAILESNIQILHSSDSDLLAAFRYIKANLGRQTSLTAIINANLMDKNGINSILTFDFWPSIMGTRTFSLDT